MELHTFADVVAAAVGWEEQVGAVVDLLGLSYAAAGVARAFRAIGFGLELAASPSRLAGALPEILSKH